MYRNKINKKACTNCGLEAAVARKICLGCNTPFYTKHPTYYYEIKDASKLAADGASSFGASSSKVSDKIVITPQPIDENGRRRTERVKREKPHFYDASEFERKYKKKDRSAKVVGRMNKVSTAKLKKKEKKRLKNLKTREALVEAQDEQIYEGIMTPLKKSVTMEFSKKMFCFIIFSMFMGHVYALNKNEEKILKDRQDNHRAWAFSDIFHRDIDLNKILCQCLSPQKNSKVNHIKLGGHQCGMTFKSGLLNDLPFNHSTVIDCTHKDPKKSWSMLTTSNPREMIEVVVNRETGTIAEVLEKTFYFKNRTYKSFFPCNILSDKINTYFSAKLNT